MLDINLQTWLGLTVVGTVVSTFGALLGIILKEYVFSRSFERWKQKQSLELLYQKYRDPLYLSARELASRVAELLTHYPAIYLGQEVLGLSAPKQVHNSIHDPYFQRHKLVSTVYRFCAFFGWLELYRQETTYLHFGNNKYSKCLERAVESIRGDLADGQINLADDWEKWNDCLIFREELRAIGESMIETRGSARAVMGYGRFVEMFDSANASPTKHWSKVILNFLLDPKSATDFRSVRMMRLVVHLVGLMKLLDAASIEVDLSKNCEKWVDSTSELNSPMLDGLIGQLLRKKAA
jgi:hypothetical protein